MNVSVERCEGLRRSEMSSRRCRSLLAVGWAPATWNTGGNAVIRSHAGRVCAAAVRIHIQMTMYRSLSSQPCPARRVVRCELRRGRPRQPRSRVSRRRTLRSGGTGRSPYSDPGACAITCPRHMRNVVAWRLLSFRLLFRFHISRLSFGFRPGGFVRRTDEMYRIDALSRSRGSVHPCVSPVPYMP